MKKYILALIATWFTTVSVYADTLGVYDPHDYLTPETEQALVKTSEDVTIGYYIVDHVGGSDIETSARNIGQEWRKDYFTSDESILVYVAIEDRKIRIATSDAVQNNKLSDNKAQRLVDDNTFKTHMRKQDYDSGLRLLSANIDQSLKTETVTTWNSSENEQEISPLALADAETAKAPLFGYIIILVLGLFGIAAAGVELDNRRRNRNRKLGTSRPSFSGESNSRPKASTTNTQTVAAATAIGLMDNQRAKKSKSGSHNRNDRSDSDSHNYHYYDHSSDSSSSIDYGGFDGGASGDW